MKAVAWNVDCVCDRSRQANVAQRRECDYTSERRVTISLRSPLLHSSSLILPSHCGSRGNIRDYYTRWRSLLMVFVDVRWRSLLMIVNCAWQFSRFSDFLKSVELFRKLQSLRSLRQSCVLKCFLWAQVVFGNSKNSEIKFIYQTPKYEVIPYKDSHCRFSFELSSIVQNVFSRWIKLRAVQIQLLIGFARK